MKNVYDTKHLVAVTHAQSLTLTGKSQPGGTHKVKDDQISPKKLQKLAQSTYRKAILTQVVSKLLKSIVSHINLKNLLE